jgi:broad specificity phosphatase PhoE
MTYDSRLDTYEHIEQVRERLFRISTRLCRRGREHDRSKLKEPELSVFNRVTPRLRELEYGSDEYKAQLADMGEALKHHYAHNSHHPEHHPDGVSGMDLLDLTEMLCDWAAAVLRHADGDLRESIEMNQERFGYSDDLKAILLNTVGMVE